MNHLTASQEASPNGHQKAEGVLERLIREYARDLRRNPSGGDDYPWEWAKGAADYLEVLIDRASIAHAASMTERLIQAAVGYEMAHGEKVATARRELNAAREAVEAAIRDRASSSEVL